MAHIICDSRRAICAIFLRPVRVRRPRPPTNERSADLRTLTAANTKLANCSPRALHRCRGRPWQIFAEVSHETFHSV